MCNAFNMEVVTLFCNQVEVEILINQISKVILSAYVQDIRQEGHRKVEFLLLILGNRQQSIQLSKCFINVFIYVFQHFRHFFVFRLTLQLGLDCHFLLCAHQQVKRHVERSIGVGRLAHLEAIKISSRAHPHKLGVLSWLEFLKWFVK